MMAVGDVWVRLSFPQGADRRNKDVSFYAPSAYNPARPMPTRYLRYLRRGYAAAVSFLDANVGRVLDALEVVGLAENTVVVFTSDHGMNLGDHGQIGKRSLFETDARVPLLIADPRAPAGHGRSAETFAELVDLFPTTAAMAGLPSPTQSPGPPLDGISLSAAVRDPSVVLKTEALTQQPRCLPLKAAPHLASSWSSGASHTRADRLQCSMQEKYAWRPNDWADSMRGAQEGIGPGPVVMGYSRRTLGWRYTAWLLWNNTALRPANVHAAPLAEELYVHNEARPQDFDKVEGSNLASDFAHEPKLVEQREALRELLERATQPTAHSECQGRWSLTDVGADAYSCSSGRCSWSRGWHKPVTPQNRNCVCAKAKGGRWRWRDVDPGELRRLCGGGRRGVP